MQYGYVYSHNISSNIIDVSIPEVMRYSGAQGSLDKNLISMAQRAIDEIRECAAFRACFMLMPVKLSDETVDFSAFCVKSKNLSKNLRGCFGAVIFSLTSGVECDRRIFKYLKTSPSYSIVFNAAATAFVEAYADVLTLEISGRLSEDGFFMRPRFSPGYGDFNILHQKDILGILDARRRTGITLSDNLMMIPSKSITAVAGISKENSGCRINGCELCEKKECVYRRNIIKE